MKFTEPALQFHSVKYRLLRSTLFIIFFAAATFCGAKANADGDPIQLNQNTFYSTISFRNESGTATGLSGNYVLRSDITVGPGDTPPGDTPVFTGIFTGVLNGFKEGGNYVISGLTRPLFDQISGVVKNLNLETVAGGTGVQGNGALANTLQAGGNVETVIVTGNVTGGANVGGLVGNSAGIIIGSSMHGDVTGSIWKIGGLVGALEDTGRITDSHTTGDVTSTGDRVGGLVGESAGEISDSSASGHVNGRGDVGGLVGYSSGDITRSHASGNVEGALGSVTFDENVGGLVGQSDGNITGSTASGDVNISLSTFNDVNNVGGLVGKSNGAITNSHALGDVAGEVNIGGLVGQSNGNITGSTASGVVNGYGGDKVGGLVGQSTGKIQDSSASGKVDGGNNSGGLVGYSEGDITGSSASGSVDGGNNSGGLVGYSVGNITKSDTTGSVSGIEYIGGLVGYSNGDITDSHARGEFVVSEYQGGPGDFVGGLVGQSNGNITGSSASADVSGGDKVGGLAGQSTGVIIGSSASGDVSSSFSIELEDGDLVIDEAHFSSGSHIGGLVGKSDGSISNSYATGDVSSTVRILVAQGSILIDHSLSSGSYIGGLVGESSGSISDSHATGSVSSELRMNWNAGITIRDDSVIASGDYVGGLVGYSAADISDSYASGGAESILRLYGLVDFDNGDSIGDNVGGLVGYSEGDITNSDATGSVRGGNKVGGLVGYSEGDITNSDATGDNIVAGLDYVGGLVGYSEGNIRSTNATGNVNADNFTGGLVGYSKGDITNSNAIGIDKWVFGLDNTGGLVGYSEGDITNSHATRLVDANGMAGPGKYVGGLVGRSNGNITNSDASGDVLGGDRVGGLVGQSNGDITGSRASGDVYSIRQVLIDFDDPGNTFQFNDYNTIDISPASSFADLIGSGSYLGGLVGEQQTNGVISGSYAEGDVTSTIEVSIENMPTTEQLLDGFAIYIESGTKLGGLVGSAAGEIVDSHAKGSVNATATLNVNSTSNSVSISALWSANPGQKHGGLVGEASASITNSSAEGNLIENAFININPNLMNDLTEVEQYTNLGRDKGGLVGHLQLDGENAGYISNSRATGNVIGCESIGGLVGSADEDTTIDLSFARGNVSGTYEVGGLVGDSYGIISNSYAIGNVTGTDNVGGLVGNSYGIISNSYAIGNVTGKDNVGGLVGQLEIGASVTHSYAIGNVTAYTFEGEGGDAGGLVGVANGIIRNSYAMGDVSGRYDVGGLVGDMEQGSVVENSYATGDVIANGFVSTNGFDADWSNGWGGLVGEFSGTIRNSYATGNVLADYHAGSLVGYFRISAEDLEQSITNSFATGVVTRGTRSISFAPERRFLGRYEGRDYYADVNHDNWALVFGGWIGCQEGGVVPEEGDPYISCSEPRLEFGNQPPAVAPSILSVVNTVGLGEEFAFKIVTCKNNGLPIISTLIASYGNTCHAPAGPNREREIGEITQTTMTEIAEPIGTMTEKAETIGFDISPKFPNDLPIGFIKSEKEFANSKIRVWRQAANRDVRTFLKKGEALKITFRYKSKDPIELWVKLSNEKSYLAGVITFEKNGEAILPLLQFKDAGKYVIVLKKPSADSIKANTQLNQIGALTVIVR